MKYVKYSVLLAVLLVLGAGSLDAQAGLCAVNVTSKTVRAEGMTEMIGDVSLRCRGPRTRDADDPLTFDPVEFKKLEVAVVVSANITNARNDDDEVMDESTATSLGYSNGKVMLTAKGLTSGQVAEGDDFAHDNDGFGPGKVSDNLRTITWKAIDTDTDTAGVQLNSDFGLGQNGNGFELKIAGLRADASDAGHGGEITVTVQVNGSNVNATPSKAASVMTGLEATVKAAKGTECANFDNKATITIKEGYKKTAFMPEDSFLITFRNIPEGVTVMVPETVALAKNDAGTTADEMAESFILNLIHGRSGDGVGKPSLGKAMVELSAAGSGEVRYTIGTYDPTPDDGAGEPEPTTDNMTPTVTQTGNYQEWANLPVYFKWSGGGVTMNSDAMVYVGFYPSGGSMIPRFVGDSSADGLLVIEDCTSKLTFPFVTSRSGFETGIAVTNSSKENGQCTFTVVGTDTTHTEHVDAGEVAAFLFGSEIMADTSAGLKATCDFTGADGYAYFVDVNGNAQGYLARRE